jgi:hypothetical protein
MKFWKLVRGMTDQTDTLCVDENQVWCKSQGELETLVLGLGGNQKKGIGKTLWIDSFDASHVFRNGRDGM